MSENEERVNVGKKLREAREKKGLTLDDLQQATKIQKRYLIAIEDEKFDELPGDFYVRAFVKQYADTVGLDGNTLLKDYDDDLPQTKTAEYSNHLAQAVETRTGNRQPTVDRVDRARRYLPTVIIAVVVVIILGAIWATAIVRNRQDAATRDRFRLPSRFPGNRRKSRPPLAPVPSLPARLARLLSWNSPLRTGRLLPSPFQLPVV